MQTGRPQVSQTAAEMMRGIEGLEREREDINAQILSLQNQLEEYRSSKFYVAVRKSSTDRAEIYALPYEGRDVHAELFTLRLSKGSVEIVWHMNVAQVSIVLLADVMVGISLNTNDDAGTALYTVHTFSSHEEAETWASVSQQSTEGEQR